MAIQNTDLLVVNRGGVDYKADVAKLKIPTDNKDLVNGAGYITSAQIPPCDFTGLATSEELTAEEVARIAEDARLDAAIKTLESGDGPDLSEYATEAWVEGKGYITLSEVPDSVLEGALVFKGNVESEAALPGDAAVGDIYFNENDNHMYAWGEDSAWHKLNTIEDVDLSEYAKTTYVDSADNALNVLIAANTQAIEAIEIPEAQDLSSYAKLNDSSQNITAKEFNGDGSKLTNLPIPEAVTIDQLPELPA